MKGCKLVSDLTPVELEELVSGEVKRFISMAGEADFILKNDDDSIIRSEIMFMLACHNTWEFMPEQMKMHQRFNALQSLFAQKLNKSFQKG